MDESAPRWAAVVVNYEVGPLARQRASVRCSPTRARASRRSWWSTTVRTTARSPRSPASSQRSACVTSETNLGYAGGVNRGVAATRAPVVAVLNADVTVEPGTAAAMLARIAAEPDLAAVGPVIRNPDGSQYPSARTVPSPGDAVGHALLGLVRPSNRFTRRYRQLDVDPTRPRDVEWLSGAALWLRRSALESVGGWDERYFMYVEDVDLCWRLRRLGWRVAYEPAGAVMHVQAVSTDQHPYRMIVRHHQSAFRFATKSWRGARRLLLLPTAVLLCRARRRRDRRPCARCATRTPARHRIASLLPCRNPADALGAPPCVPVIASRSAVGVDRWAGTSPSPSSSSSASSSSSSPVRTTPAARGTGPPHAANPTTGEAGRSLAHLPRGEHLRPVARPRSPRSRRRSARRPARRTPASTPTATA